MSMEFYQTDGQALLLHLKAKPRSGKTGWGKLVEGRLELRLAAAPVEGAANQECLKFVAKALGCPKSRVKLLQGENHPYKTLRLEEYQPQALEKLLRQLQTPGSA